MQVGRAKGATRVLGKSQNYAGLPIRDEVVLDKSDNKRARSMLSVWFPTPKELEALNAGAPVQVRLLGCSHPPIIVDVGEPPEEEPACP